MTLARTKVIKQQEVFHLIRSLVGQAHVLTIPRIFIDFTADIPSALLLAQLIYWTERATRPDGYIWKTYREWEKELSLNEYQVRKATNKLKTMGILKTALHKVNGNPTVHYLLNQSEFLESLVQFLNKRKCKNQTNEDAKIEQTNNIEYRHKLHSKITDKKIFHKKVTGYIEKETRYSREGMPELVQSEVPDGKQ